MDWSVKIQREVPGFDLRHCTYNDMTIQQPTSHSQIGALLCTGMANDWHTATGTDLDDVPLSFLSPASSTYDEDEDIFYGRMHQSLPAEPTYEPTWVPAYSVSPAPEQKTEEAEAFLTWADTSSLQSSSLAAMEDGETPVVDLVTEQADDMMAIAEGTD
jgi:hypothetical protein